MNANQKMYDELRNVLGFTHEDAMARINKTPSNPVFALTPTQPTKKQYRKRNGTVAAKILTMLNSNPVMSDEAVAQVVGCHLSCVNKLRHKLTARKIEVPTVATPKKRKQKKSRKKFAVSPKNMTEGQVDFLVSQYKELQRMKHTRAAAEVRHIFTKQFGAISEPSVRNTLRSRGCTFGPPLTMNNGRQIV